MEIHKYDTRLAALRQSVHGNSTMQRFELSDWCFQRLCSVHVFASVLVRFSQIHHLADCRMQIIKVKPSNVFSEISRYAILNKTALIIFQIFTHHRLRQS